MPGIDVEIFDVAAQKVEPCRRLRQQPAHALSKDRCSRRHLAVSEHRVGDAHFDDTAGSAITVVRVSIRTYW
ncbi:hypothetical protein D9M68_550940 [compost metagenome]